MSRSRIAQQLLLLTASFAVTAGVGAAIIGGTPASATSAGHSRTAAAQASSGGIQLRDPIVVGREVPAATAAAEVGFRMPMPQASAMVPAVKVTQAWVDPVRHRVALILDGGRVTIMMWPVQSGQSGALSRFRLFEKTNHADIRIGSIHGQPALIIKQRTDEARTNPAWIEFYRNGIDINVFSHSYGSAALLQLAQHLG
jgi:hypothetical protein